ncbi:putative (S)-ureidoglycine aminohydrolase, cupin domain, acetate kinase EutQ, rmlC-like jelly roll [Septoria linicola]|nr:putative (S)-ureidoglycine aminohydrolase, cupin domain, acetate kinase EutQ, rmlC-like jelly roll [Septoria linicola]
MAPTLQHFPQAHQATLHQYNEHQNIQIGDTASSVHEDPQSPITSGFFTLQKGCKATTTFGFSEYKYVLSGTFIVSDQSGQRFVGKPGDVIYIPKGSTVTFETEEGGKTFFVAQRLANESRRAGVVAKL